MSVKKLKDVEGRTSKPREASTLDRLKVSLEEIQGSGQRITISAVARTASVTPGLIHNTYPDFAEKIRSLMGKSTRSRKGAIAEELKRVQRSSKELRVELALLRDDLAKLASRNQMLAQENEVLRAMAGSVVTHISKNKNLPAQH